MTKPNYRVTLSFDGERKVFVAKAPELSHCTADGGTRGEAVSALEVEIEAQLANMLGHGTQPPASVDEQELSGVVQAKVTHTLHRELLWQARQEGVELDHLVGEILAAALESRRSQRGQRSSGNRQAAESLPHDGVGNERGGHQPQRGPRPGNRYQNSTHLLDDRANFIEYVRNLEHGQNGQTSHGPGHGHGGPGASNGGLNARRDNNHNNANNNRRRRRGGVAQGGGPGNNGSGNGGPVTGGSGGGNGSTGGGPSRI